jgi:CRP-like cAMP-binding protein
MRVMLQNVPILAGLDPAAIDQLCAHAIESIYPVGSLIVREGETSNRFFLIAEGTVRICRQFGQADEIELAQLGRGEFFGEMCILETLPRAATVQAICDTTVVSLTSMAFYHLYQALPAQHSILVLNIARDLSRRLRHLGGVFAARH